MSTNIVNKYRLFDTVTQTYVYVWSDTVPVICPNGDAIDSTMTTVIDNVSTNTVFISGKTYGESQGYYHMRGYEIDLAADQTHAHLDVSFPFPICIYGMNFNTSADQEGDALDIVAYPNTTIGYLTGNVAINDTLIHVSPTCAENIVLGGYITLADGTNSFESMISSIDKINNTITFETPSTFAFNAYTTLTIMNIYISKNYTIDNPNKYTIGYGTNAGKPLSSNVVIRVTYYNNNATLKKFRFNVEMTY